VGVKILADDSFLDLAGVYVIKNLVTRKIYVGSTKEFWTRLRCHLSDLRRNKHRNRHLQKAWNKYGNEAFVFEILEVVSDLQQLVEVEQTWIDKLQASDERFGYNICPNASSCLGRKFPEEMKQVISERLKGVPQVKTYTERGRRKISASRSKAYIVVDPHGKEHEVIGLRQFCSQNHLVYQKMASIANGRGKSHRGWRCRHIDKALIYQYVAISPDGTYHEVFDLIDFCRTHQIDGYSIGQVIKGNRSHHKSWRCYTPDSQELLKAEWEDCVKPFDPSEHNGKAAAWIVVSPDGVEQMIRNLKKFCGENQLSYDLMRMVANGKLQQYKGWRCQRSS
jgi:group I intron endonuclease